MSADGTALVTVWESKPLPTTFSCALFVSSPPPILTTKKSPITYNEHKATSNTRCGRKVITRILLLDALAERRAWLLDLFSQSNEYVLDCYDQLSEAVTAAPDYDVILTYDLPLDPFQILTTFKQRRVDRPLILLATDGSEALALRAWRQGYSDYLPAPVEMSPITAAIRRVTAKKAEQTIIPDIPSHLVKTDRDLVNYVKGLDYAIGVSKAIAGDLLLEDVLSNVVAAATKVASADTASLLLQDETTGDLYVRASYNLETQLVETLRLRVDDSLAGQAIRSGRPVIINGQEQQKIKTAYLVKSLVYMPLHRGEKVIGVLGVDNRITNRVFVSWQIKLLGLLADFASIALSNANRFMNTQQERDTLEAILAGTSDPVMVVDSHGQVILANPAASAIFDIPAGYYGPILSVIDNADVLRLLDLGSNKQSEFTLDDDRTFQAHMTLVKNVGLVMVMRDISQLKEIDRLKSNFVVSISQDLRSPLTAIMGYVDLIARVGPLNAQQLTFADRIMLSAQSITSEITDLLDLSRIETSSSEINFENVILSGLLQYAIATVEGQVTAKQLDLTLDVADNLLKVWGNAQRLKQMIRNLLDNAIQFTPERGQIHVTLRSYTDLVMLQIQDDGIGIPLEDQPHIFDKFYRAESVREDYNGSGLGLAIVKSILDRHNGRIWVQSEYGCGSTFTVLLPAVERARSKHRLDTSDLLWTQSQ